MKDLAFGLISLILLDRAGGRIFAESIRTEEFSAAGGSAASVRRELKTRGRIEQGKTAPEQPLIVLCSH